MIKLMQFLAAMIMLTSLSALGGEVPLTADTDVIIESQVQESPGRNIIVTGSTNLPDGTHLTITIENKSLGSFASSNVVVKNGSYTSGEFGGKDGLKEGIYEIEVLMPAPFVQPKSVQEIIGSEGENLSGPLVTEDFIGVVVSTRFNYEYGAAEQIQTNYTEHSRLIKDLESEANRLISVGRNMGRLRYSDPQACIRLMNEHRDSADELARAVSELPNSYLLLKAASIDIKMCLLCSRNSLQACSRASNNIEESRSSRSN